MDVVTDRYNAKLVLLACVLVSIGQFASVIYLPSLPAITTDLHATASSVAATLTMYMFFFGVSQLLGGAASDEYGRKPLIYFGMVLYTLSAIVCALAPSVVVLLIGRGFEGLGAGCITAVSRALLNDTHTGKPLTKALSYTAITASTVSMLAPVLGGAIQVSFQWRGNFWYLAFYCFVILIICLWLLPETRQVMQRQKGVLPRLFANYKSLLQDKKFVTYVLLGNLAFAAISSYYVASPFLFQYGLHLNPVTYGLVFLFTSSGFISGSLFNTHAKLNAKQLITFASLLMLTATLILLGLSIAHIFTFWSLIIPVTTLTFCVGILYPRGMAEAVAPFKHIAGSAAAFYGFAQMVLASFGVLIMSSLPKSYPFAMALLLSIVALTVVLILLFNRKSIH